MRRSWWSKDWVSLYVPISEQSLRIFDLFLLPREWKQALCWSGKKSSAFLGTYSLYSAYKKYTLGISQNRIQVLDISINQRYNIGVPGDTYIFYYIKRPQITSCKNSHSCEETWRYGPKRTLFYWSGTKETWATLYDASGANRLHTNIAKNWRKMKWAKNW